MFKDKTIKFGYGTVLVNSDEYFREVTLKYIKPPKEVGEIILDNKSFTVLDEIVFEFGKDMLLFYEELKQITPENTVLEFRGYKFDFSNYNEKSVEVVLRGFKRAIQGFLLALAC